VVTDVTMPQMGETVTEGTITVWLKQPGDEVAEDEPLLEISTDKVDSDVPAPASGVLTEILVPEGETVPIGTLLARIGGDGSGPQEIPAADVRAEPAPSPTNGDAAFLSPVVRRLVAEHQVDVAGVAGSGAGGRVTKEDVLRVVATAPPLPTITEGDADTERVPFSAMRRTIGAHMVDSLQTAAHTLVVVEVDYAAVAAVKDETGLTWLPFIARAAVDALGEFPHLNAHVDPDGLTVHRHVHLGVAVDLDHEGLVVPVVRRADRLRLEPLAESLSERAAAARDRSLTPDDFAGGTFTITNAGRYGTLFTAPIINQPQAAILATDGVTVRPVALELGAGEYGLAFHPVGNLALSFDHRAVDGAYASAFLARVRDLLETRDWDGELWKGPR
jgi:2-oxoglutarate dehydrogenase E2 component (dihydrolipoamide succinyltransferase)